MERGYKLRNSLITTAAIEVKSKELDLPLESVLATYVMEQLAVMLAESEYGRQLLLKNPDAIGLRVCGRSGGQKLYYSYMKKQKEKFGKAGFSAILKNTIKWEKKTNIEWSWRSHLEGRELFVEVCASLDDMKVPVELVIEPMEQEQLTSKAGEMTLHQVMDNSKTSVLYLYPAEKLLMDDLREIFEKQSLIGDMSVYDRVYEILSRTSLEGRKYQTMLEEYFKTKGIPMDEVRYQQLERYANDSFMQKKWKAYLKKSRKTDPSWQEVYGRFWCFQKPLWLSSMKEIVYLGIWIPDLGRYLD